MVRERLGLWLWSAVLLATLIAVAPGAADASERVMRISSASGYAENPILGVDARGDQTAAWTDYRSSDPAQFSVVTATRRFGASEWTRPRTLSEPSPGPDEPTLAVSRSGAAVIAWVETVPQGRPHALVPVLEVSTRASVSATWTGPAAISPTGAQVSGLAVGIDGRGAATAVWNQGDATNPPIEYATASAATGQWSRPQQLVAAGGGGLDPQLVVNARGDTLVAWSQQTALIKHRDQQPTIHSAEMVAYRPVGDAWESPVPIGRLSEIPSLPGGQIWAPSTPTVALDALGGASVMWQSIHGHGQVLEVAHRPAAMNRWQPPATVAANPIAPVIATAAKGALTVVWTDSRGGIVIVGSKDGEHWTRSTASPRRAGAFITWLSVGPSGNAILAWLGAHERVLVSERPGLDTAWTPAKAIGRGGFPQAALGPAGNAALIWPQLVPRPRFGAVIDAADDPIGGTRPRRRRERQTRR